MTNKYLIMKCEELHDQYECEADRTPIALVENIEEWYTKENPKYLFEIWELKEDGNFKCIRDFYTPLEKGMIWICYDRNEKANGNWCVVQKYPNRVREEGLPHEILTKIEEAEDINDELARFGCAEWSEDYNYYAFTEYWNNMFEPPF